MQVDCSCPLSRLVSRSWSTISSYSPSAKHRKKQPCQAMLISCLGARASAVGAGRLRLGEPGALPAAPGPRFRLWRGRLAHQRRGRTGLLLVARQPAPHALVVRVWQPRRLGRQPRQGGRNARLRAVQLARVAPHVRRPLRCRSQRGGQPGRAGGLALKRRPGGRGEVHEISGRGRGRRRGRRRRRCLVGGLHPSRACMWQVSCASALILLSTQCRSNRVNTLG